MQSKHTTRHICYLSTQRAGDRALIAKLRAERARGVSTSQVLKLALSQYYDRPALPSPELVQLTEAVATLSAAVAALQAEVRELRLEREVLKLQLIAATFGDRAQRKEATGQAARLLTAGNNGHD